ncbi:helix-turn-helix transcriptional regulator [Proteiniclasticum sp.]|uniref:helix-turn-helix transcriptional regulator n=1 Tax=Proteiniclasticum sp. TaxID=2053595 RepID=UPI00289D16ED|nr:helix-turn-helix transcriptional regulator [Proteiniclasticum sp.]
MNQEKVIQVIKQSMEEMGVKGIFLANSIGISYTFMKQVLNGERNFSPETLERATIFFNRYPYFFNI